MSTEFNKKINSNFIALLGNVFPRSKLVKFVKIKINLMRLGIGNINEATVLD